LIIDDILKVIYAPKKAFKNIIANPKYLGAIIVLVLFLALQVGYEYSQFSKTNIEQTAPTADQFPTFINASAWTASSGVTLTNHDADYFNYSVYIASFGTTPTDPLGYYSLFGNSSLQIEATNTSNLTVALGGVFNVDCSEIGFQNLSMTIKQVEPQTAPQTATLTLYSLSDIDFYRYDLTSELSAASIINQWGNLTIPIGKTAQGWTSNGTPSWSNITALTLDLTYPENSNITLRVGALFFRGQYLSPIEFNSAAVLLQFLQVFTLQFIAGWLILSAILYLFFKAFKGAVVWKPLFVAVGFALFVMVIRGLVNLVGTFTLPTLYMPFDMTLGLRFNAFGVFYYPAEAVSTLSVQTQTAIGIFESATSTLMTMTSAIFLISYVWLAGLCTIIVGELKPEFSLLKRIAMSSVSVAATILLLLFLIGIA
jgi:hypothetical protein